MMGQIYGALVEKKVISLTLSACLTEPEIAAAIKEDFLKKKVTLYYSSKIHTRRFGDFGVLEIYDKNLQLMGYIYAPNQVDPNITEAR